MTMSDVSVTCPRGLSKPQLFILICISSSVLIGILSSVYLYYPNPQFMFGRMLDAAAAEGSQSQSQSQQISHPIPPPGSMKSDKLVVNVNLNSNGDQDPAASSVNVQAAEEVANSSYYDELSDDDAVDSEGKPRFRHGHHYEKMQLLTLSDLAQTSNQSHIIQTRLFHLDLKGAPPKIQYLKEVIKLCKEAGLTGVLLEWEDTFPWTNSLQNITLLEGGYSLEEAEDLVHFIESYDLIVIPLIQTFGHVEFILKGAEFRYLRETDDEPQAFCPSKSGALNLIQEMLNQIFEVHKNSQFIHIGCDEVFNIRRCSECLKNSDSRDSLFLNHVVTVGNMVRQLGKIPIVWDDMLRSVPEKKLVDSGIGSIVEPMVWVYAEDVDRFVGWETWEKYSTVFPTIWAAGAFKGAFGETIQIPPLSRHAANTQRWLEILSRESVRWTMGLGGFVLTGWQRYDHFAVLCEILPASIPSLVYSSLVLSTVPNIPSASGSMATLFRNRVFVPKDLESGFELSSSTSTESSANLRRRKRSGSGRRWIPHPQTLRIKEKEDRVILSQFTGPGGFHASGRGGDLIAGMDKNERIWRQFSKLLHCPPYSRSLERIIKDHGDTDLSFAGRCNFQGVIFFRSLFGLRTIINEAWTLEAHLKRGRGWLTNYNVRHGFSVPIRIEELIYEGIPRLKRNLALKAKSIANSLKPIFRNEVILEWLEQNIWDAWNALHEIEAQGEKLKVTSVWPRRPLKSSVQIIRDLGLLPLQLVPREEL